MSSSAAAPMTVRTWSSAANTSAGVFAIARPSASRWSLARAASGRSARRSSGKSESDRWTSLDRALRDISDECGGVADLRPGPDAEDPELRRLLLGRAAKLERLGLADPVGPACWTLKPGLEPALRQLGIRGDIIKTMHQAMSAGGHEPDVSSFALHGEEPSDPVLGRLVKRGLDDELKGTAYAIIAGVDGRTHHLKFSDLEMTGDAPAGAIVEARSYDDANGRRRLSLATRSDLSIEAQVTASGATWLDRQLLAKDPPLSGGGFGAEVRHAMEARVDHLAVEGLAHRQGQRVIFARDLLATLRRRELEDAAAKLSAETGLAYQPAAEGERVSGVYRQRVTLASGRFAMIDDGLGFQLVPWRPALGEGARTRGARRHRARRERGLEFRPKTGAGTMRIALRTIRLLRYRVQVPDPPQSGLAPAFARRG